MNLIRGTFKKKTWGTFWFWCFNNLRKATLRYGHYLKVKKYFKRLNHGQKPDTWKTWVKLNNKMLQTD